MNIVIVEDEDMVAARLQRLITESLAGREHTITRFSSLEAARAGMDRPDVVFLDLNLNGKDGFDLLHWSLAGPQQTIVASANTDRAIEAYELGVADFIPKPFSLARVSQAIERATGVSPDKDKTPDINRLFVRIGTSTRIVPVTEIIRISSVGGYSELHLEDGSVLDHNWSLERLERSLPDSFFRIHRQHIIALSRVKSLVSRRGSQYHLVTRDGERYPVGRSRVAGLRERLAE